MIAAFRGWIYCEIGASIQSPSRARSRDRVAGRWQPPSLIGIIAVDVDEYIASQSEAVQSILERVRSTIRKAMPGAEEVIFYGIPSYKLRGVGVLFFAGWKQHYSLYPANERVVAEFKVELAPYEISKGTIRFPLSKPVPMARVDDERRPRTPPSLALAVVRRPGR